ncbi:PREDICTED: otopetrin-3-like [Nanorana parkeri]|uniref:otopetrin-3-like n=1 Tax=Nanorana parkeri TaxID=125878 RepID=UPI000854BC3D|nr:PREDICTED: otopetrin-3-like [Nanorana parkeri]
MVATDLSQTVAQDRVGLGYEHSWLHRHCPSTPIHHKRARGSGRLFSGLVAMNVIFLGAALISSAILSSMPPQNSHIFLSALMLCSSGWILFYLLRTRKKPFSVVIQDHHAGAFWLRASLILFGLCSLLLAVFKIGYDVTLITCKLPMDIVFSVMEVIFISTQTCFLWLSCRDCVQIHHDVTRCGIMLSLATNFLLWLMAVINDSVHREIESLQPNSTSANLVSSSLVDETSACLCLEQSICWSFQRGYVTLFPFNLEYSLVCTSMLYIMWRNVGRKDVSSSASSHPRLRLQGVLYGPVLGGAALMVGFCIFLQYQVQAALGDAAPMSFILYYVYSVTLLPIMLISCIAGIIAQSFKEKQMRGQSEEQSEHDENKNDSDRATKQQNKNLCRHRHVEKSKDDEQRGVDAGKHREQKVEYEWTDQEEFEEHKGNQEESCEKCEKESGNFSECIPIEELVKEDRADHIDPNHHYRTTKKQIIVETSPDFAMCACQKPKNYTRSLDIILLLAASLGQFCISYYSIVALVARSIWNLLNSLKLAYSALMILQHISQNIFIIEGMRKEHHGPSHSTTQEESTEEASRRMSLLEIRRVSLAYLQSVGRLSISRRLVKEIALFLVLCNIMLWIMSAFGDHPQYTNGLEREFYGSSTWFSILNFGLPLSVFYRMHSVGGLLEAYLTA